VKDKIRIITGARYESYSQKIIIDEGKKDSVYVNNTTNDLLPSFNFIYNINEKFALRLSYYKTLNRAEFRELAVTNWYDPETRLSIAGNSELKRAYINNYDLRFEVYPGRGQLFTTSGFYKKFNNPIEKYMFVTSESQIYYRNANDGYIYGGELEYRVNLGAILKKDSVKFLSNLTLFSNLSLMKSSVNVKGIQSGVPDTRQMQGQAPYLINAGLSYVDNKKDFSVSMMVNRVGEKIYLVGNDILPNRWENARTVLDMQATKTLLKKRLEIRLNVKDLLHPDWVIYYKGNDRTINAYNKKVDYVNFKRNFGTTYSFVITYKF
jgi:outer membrane receptor protein involved in Fe transport